MNTFERPGLLTFGIVLTALHALMMMAFLFVMALFYVQWGFYWQSKPLFFGSHVVIVAAAFFASWVLPRIQLTVVQMGQFCLVFCYVSIAADISLMVANGMYLELGFITGVYISFLLLPQIVRSIAKSVAVESVDS